MDQFKIWEGVQVCILSPWLFNFYAEYIIWNARLNESQAGIKIAGRDTKNLRYAEDTPQMAENEEPKSLLMRVKEERECLFWIDGIWQNLGKMVLKGLQFLKILKA